MALTFRERGRSGMRGSPAPSECVPASASPARQWRICHLGKYYPPAPGGVEAHVQALARGQTALGCQVDVVCVNHRNRHGKDITWDALDRTTSIVEVDGQVRIT